MGRKKKQAPNERRGEISRKKELNEMEASKLPDTELKTMVIRMLKELSENFNSMENEMKPIKKNQQKGRTQYLK